MDQNVSASPGDADNLVRKKPNAPTDATAPGGIDAAVANAKASAQVAGRTEFMASKLSTVRDASRSEDPTPVSLPKLQPIVGVNTGVVAASDLPTPATTVQGPSPVDLTVTPPGLERAGGTGDPPPVIAKVAWHDVAPPSGSETTVMVPPSNGSVAVEGTGAGSSSTKKSADGKNVLVAIAENLTAGINPSPPPAVRVDLRDAGAPPARQLLTTSTDLSKHRADLTATLSDQKPLVAAVEPTALTTVASTNVVFSQPTLNAVTENLGSEILTTGVDGSADQAPLKLNISFQPTNSSEINAPAATKIPLGPPVAAQPEVVAKTQTAATASLSDRSGHVIGNNALSLGNLRETNLTLSQSGLPALTGASVPDAAITQYQPPPLQPALIADLSRLNSSFQNGSDGSLTKNIMLTGATGNPTQSLLVAAISPYNVSFSPTDVTTLANIKPANLPAGTEQLGQKPPLRLALANSVALGATDYSVGTLPTVTTVSLRPSELNTSTAPLVLQANLTSPSTDFRPTKQELSTTPIVLSTSLVPQDNSLATLNEAPPVLKSLEPTQVTSQPGRSVVQRSNLGVGELRQPDAEIVTATPVTLTADLLRTTGDATQDRRVALSSNIASEANGNALITAMNFPLNFPSVEATATAPMTLANSVQSQPFFPTNDNARAVLTSQPLSSGEAIVLNSSSTTKPSIFDQSRDMIALGTTINSIPSDPGDFSLFLPPTKGATIDSTLLTEAGNSNALYRPPTAVSGATFQTGSTEFPLSVPLSTQTGLSGSAARLAELNIASPDNSQLMTKISLGLLNQPDASAIKSNNSGAGIVLASATTNDTTLPSRAPDISNAPNILSDANRTTSNYIAPNRSFEPVQPASTSNALVVEPTNFALQRQIATPLTFDNSGSRGEIADALIAPPTPFSPITKATAYQVADGSAATFTPSNSYAEAPPPSTVATVFPGNTAVFHVNDSALTTIATGSSTLATAYLPQGSDAGISTGVVATSANEATKITPNSSELSLGLLREPAAFAPQPSGSLVASTSRNDTTLDTNSLTRNVADISSATNLLANGTTANYVPSIKPFEPVQLASTTNALVIEPTNFAMQRQVATPLTFDNSGSRGEIADALIAPPTPFSPITKATAYQVADGSAATFTPSNSYAEAPPPSTVATVFPGNTAVFHVNDSALTTIATGSSTLATAYLPQGSDAGISTGVVAFPTNEATTKITPNSSELSLGLLREPAAFAPQPSGSLVASTSRNDTTLDTNSLTRNVADISNATNLLANGATANYVPSIKPSEPVQLASTTNALVIEPTNFAMQRQVATPLTFDNSGSRGEIADALIAPPTPFSPITKATAYQVADGSAATFTPSNSYAEAPPPSTVATVFPGNTAVFHVNDSALTTIATGSSTLATAYLPQGSDAGISTGVVAFPTNEATPKITPKASQLSLGSLRDSEALPSQASGPVVTAGLRNDTTIDTISSTRTVADISSATNLLANGTTANYVPSIKPSEPIQLASTTNALVIEPTNFAMQRQVATPLTFDNSGSRGEIADALIAPPTPFSPITKATAYQVADGSAATFTPSNSYAEAPPPSTVATVIPGNTAVFHVNDSALTTIATGSSTLATAYLPQGSDAGISTGVVAFPTNEATPKITPKASQLSLGSLRDSEALPSQASGPVVTAGLRNDTTIDTISSTRTVADISSATNLLANGTTINYVPLAKSFEPVQLASNGGEQSNLSTRGRQPYQPLTYGNTSTLDFSTSVTADGAPYSPQIKNFGAPAVQSTFVTTASSSASSAFDAPPSQAKPPYNVASLNQPLSNDYAVTPLPTNATINFRSGNGDSITPPITVQVADLRSTTTTGGSYASNLNAADFARSAVTTATQEVPSVSGVKLLNSFGQPGEPSSSVGDAQALVAKLGQTAARSSTNQLVAQNSGGYARLSTSALANTTTLSNSDVHALTATTQTPNLTGVLATAPLDGVNKTGTSSLAIAANPLSAGPVIAQEMSKGIALPNVDRLTATTTVDSGILVGSKAVVVADGKGASAPLEQTLHPIVGKAPSLVGDAGLRPVSGNVILLDLTHAPMGPGGLDPSIKVAVTVVKPPETDFTGAKTVINGQILTGRLPDGTALRPDPNGIIFSVKGAGAEVDPAGSKLLTINQKIELIGPATTAGVVGTTTGIISGAVSEINIIGPVPIRGVRIGGDALVDSTLSTINGHPTTGLNASTGKGAPLVAGSNNPDPTSAVGLIATTASGQPVPPNSTAGSPVAPLGSSKPDEDKNQSGVAPGNTGIVVGNTVVPLPNVEFFDGKLNNTRIVAGNRTEEVVNDTLVHGALPPLAGMDQTVSEILAARNGKQDPGIPNFDSNLSPLSTFGDPKRFEPTGGIASNRFGDDIADGKEIKSGHRIDLGAEEGQLVDPKTHINPTKEADPSSVDSLAGKKEAGSKSEIEDGLTARSDANKAEDSELSDDVRNQMTTLLTDQSENLTGVSDRRTVKDFIDELLHHTKRRSYRIESGDTLEKLARRFLKDKRLAHLIYLLNEDLLGNQADFSNIQLRAGQVLIMPSIEDVLQYRIHILHDVMPPHIYKNIMDNPDERIVGSSKLLRATYSCRFGDRLTSVAARHSAIRDEKLWTLIAQLNGLSTATDRNGQPKVALKRAQKLILPSRKDIEDHFRRSSHGMPAKLPVAVPSIPVVDPEIDAFVSPAEERATVNWGDGSDLPTPLSALAQKVEPGTGLSNRELGPDTAPKSGGTNGPNSKGPKSKPRRIEPNEARIVAPEDLGEGSEEICLRLEFQYEGKWLPVIEYTGTKEQIYLHIYTLAGRTDSIPIALPTRSIRELAECDLGANYQRYCQKFLEGDRPI